MSQGGVVYWVAIVGIILFGVAVDVSEDNHKGCVVRIVNPWCDMRGRFQDGMRFFESFTHRGAAGAAVRGKRRWQQMRMLHTLGTPTVDVLVMVLLGVVTGHVCWERDSGLEASL